MREEQGTPAFTPEDPFDRPPSADEKMMLAGRWDLLKPALKSMFEGKRTKELRREGVEKMGEPPPEELDAVNQVFEEMEEDVAGAGGMDPGSVRAQFPDQTPEHISEMAGRIYSGGRTQTRNLNFDYMESTDAAKSLVNALAEDSGGFMQQRRGVRSHEVTGEAAVSPEVFNEVKTLVGGKPGTSWNAEQLVAGRKMVLRLAEDVAEQSRKITESDGGTKEDQARLVRLHRSLTAVQRAVQGGVAEAGRALNSMKMIADPAYPRERMLQLDDVVRTAGGTKNVLDMAKAYSQATSPQEVTGLSRTLKNGLSKGIQTVQEIWINSILSGVQTHVVNVMGNTLVQGYESGVVKPLQAGIGMLRQGVGKALGKEVQRVYLSEIPAEFVGKTQGMIDTFAAMGRERLKYLDSLDAEQKIENPKYRAISAENYGLAPEGAVGKTVDKLGGVIRIPGTLLSVGDDMFKSIVYRGEINTLAVRQGISEGLDGQALQDRIYELMQDPTGEMHASAKAMADKLTFTESLEGQGDGFLSWFGRMIQEGNEKYPVMRFFTPFVRTPTNIMRYMIDNSVLAPLTKEWRTEFMAGGIRRDAAIARYGASLAITATVLNYTESGVVTGKGPSDYKLRQQLEATGWRPNSILVNGNYISYDRGDPLGGMLGFVADAADLVRYSEDEKTSANIVAAAFGGVLQNFSNKTYVSGFNDMVGLLAGGDDVSRLMERWVKRTATGMIPFSSFLRTFRKGDDEILRDTRNRNDFSQSLINSFANTVPGYSDALPASLDWKGEVRTMEAWLPARALSPVRYAALKGDAPSLELVDNGVVVSEPPYLLDLGYGDRMNLLEIDHTGHLYNKYKEMVGKARYEEVKAAIVDLNSDPETQNSGVDSLRADELQKAVSDGRKYGENDFLDWYEQNQYKNPEWPYFDEDTLDRHRQLNTALIQAGKPQSGPFNFKNISQSGLIPEKLKKQIENETPRF